MAKEHSFDIVSKVDLQEVDNAINQTIKEIQNRFDFKGSKSKIELEDNNIIKVVSDDEFKLKSVIDILQTKLIKRGISLKALDYGKIEQASGNTARQLITLKQGLSKDNAKKITKIIKDLKLKINAQVQEDQVRVSAKNIDDLQVIIKLLKEKDFDFALQFINYR